MITISEVMSKEVQRTTAETTVALAAKQMRDSRVGSLLVERNQQPVGIVTDTDVVRKAVAEGMDLANTPVENIMVPLNNIHSTQTLLDAHDMMRDRGARHLAVWNSGKVVGVLSVGDLAAYFTWLSDRKFPPP